MHCFFLLFNKSIIGPLVSKCFINLPWDLFSSYICYSLPLISVQSTFQVYTTYPFNKGYIFLSLSMTCMFYNTAVFLLDVVLVYVYIFE